MNVRRMIMVMLVLVCLVQGVSALDSIVLSSSLPSGLNVGGGSDTDTWVIEPEYYGQPVTVVYNTYLYSNSTSRCSAPNIRYIYAHVDLGSDSETCSANPHSKSGIVETTMPSSGNLVVYNNIYQTGAYSGMDYWVYSASVSAVYTFNETHTASGESCYGLGTFDIFTDGAYTATDSTDGNYSFTIAEGVEYQIHYTSSGVDEWHNFTAGTTNETWNFCPGTYTVSGTLLGPDGEGTNNALINLHNYTAFSSPTPANSGVSSSTGTYSFENTEYGSYYIVACGYGPCYPYTYYWFYVVDSDVIVANLTYPEKINIRFRVLDSNSTPQSGLYLHVQDVPSDHGGWMSTDADGYTSYNAMYPSSIYVEIIDADMTTLATTIVTGNAQYEYQLSTITLPAPDANNTTIPVIPPDSNNSTPPSQPPGDGSDIGGGTVTDPGDYACTNTLTASVQDTDHSPIDGAAIKLYPYNSSISGSHTGTTDAAGEYTFPCTNATLSYNVEARATCYEHEIAEDEGYSGTAYFHLNKTLTLACGFDDGSGGGGTGTNGTDGGDPDLIAESTISDDTMKAPILNNLWAAVLLVLFYMVATFYKRK